MCVRVHACEHRCLKRPEVSNLLDLQLQAVVKSHPIRVLRTELGFSERAICTLNHRATSPALLVL